MLTQKGLPHNTALGNVVHGECALQGAGAGGTASGNGRETKSAGAAEAGVRCRDKHGKPTQTAVSVPCERALQALHALPDAAAARYATLAPPPFTRPP